jgi:alpha-galactosidase/6-phospho-beta-glucosidase family protein
MATVEITTNKKIVLIGGGSYNWTPTLALDLFCTPGLRNSELVLVDVDEQAGKLMLRYARKLAETVDTGWQVTFSALDEALAHADIVCVSISTGGLTSMEKDLNTAEKYGVYQTVGDTTGPAGISRTLRNVPIFIDIARKMESLCPDAWMVHVTNPLNQLTRAVNRYSSIPCIGLCHNYAGTVSLLADYFGVTEPDVNAVSVGVNHGSWLTEIWIAGRPVDPEALTLEKYLAYLERKKDPLVTNTTDDTITRMRDTDWEHLGAYLAFELYETLGVYPVGDACHLTENLPWYNSSLELLKKHKIRKKGVLPHREQYRNKRKQEVLEILDGKKAWPEVKKSREQLSGVAEALLTGGTYRGVFTLPNRGQISNLPLGVSVETQCVVSYGAVQPEFSGEVPVVLRGIIQSVVDEMELSVEAAEERSRKKLIQALYVSPELQNKDCVEALADEIIANNREWLDLT